MNGFALKVHVLGAGSIGSLVAHELRQQFPNTLAATVLVRPERRVEEPTHIRLKRLYDLSIPDSSVEVQTAKPSMKDDVIENLIVTTKAFQTQAAISPYIDRLNSESNVLLIQNGMGMVSNLTDKFWKHSLNKPRIFEGITTHGVFMGPGGIVNHAARGTIQISSPSFDSALNELPLVVQTLLETPQLNAEYLPYEDFVLRQMEKLVVNCCINPLTAIFDVENGHLLSGEQVPRIWKSIIAEAVDALLQEYPILATIPTAAAFLNHGRLLNSVISVCSLTAKNSSSMRQDMLALRTTEIESMNGYIAYLGRKHGRNTPTNKWASNLVRSKLDIDRGINNAAADALLSQ
ncbi:uncharacterized protein LODBEIA_P54780 [Lodderomyces beijingensis]|uniref:2-dehydropantoate 2-reductase n=1 Tax=Lodderomyces beijingensis TaxID=1775926 RepID=A0ABP0ZTN5_9ASCO